MKISTGAGAIALALLLAACGDGGTEGNLNAVAAEDSAPIEQIAPPAGQQWTDMVRRTEQGGVIVGNPDAPVKVVEFASYTCPACATFSREGGQQLIDEYVSTGQVSFELRSYVRSAPDAAITLLTQCLPEGSFFRVTEQLFAQQQEVVGGIDDQEAQRLESMPEGELIPALARAMELDTFMARRGLPQSRFEECISDRDALSQLAERTQQANEQYNLRGTPSFLINDQLVDASQWNQLEPRIRAAVRR